MIGVFVLLAGWYSLVIPSGEGLDEVPHFAYVHFVRETRSLPIQPWGDNEREMVVWMGHHPPLYYVAGALLSGWTDTRDWERALRANPRFVWTEHEPRFGWNVTLQPPDETLPPDGARLALHYLRLWSVALGGVALLAIYRTGRLLLPAQPWISVTAIALVGLNPSFVYTSSTVHHDALIVMIYALSLWWMVHALQNSVTPGMALVGGGLLAAGLLTKLSGLTLVGLFGLTILLVAHRSRDPRIVLRLGVPVFGIALIAAGWWYLRNYLLYGDPLGWAMFLSTHAHMVRPDPYTLSTFRDEFLAQLGRTYWGAFGYMHILLPQSFHRVMWTLTAVGATGAGVAAARWQTLWQKGRWRAWLVLLTAVGLVFASFVRFSMATVGAGHGRYLLTVAGPLALAMSIGLNALTALRAQRLIAGAVTLGLAGYAVIAPIRYVLPLYAPPDPTSPVVLERAERVAARFGDSIELAGYSWEPRIVAPGNEVELALHWRALGNSRPDLYVDLTLRDRFGSAFHQRGFWPLPAHPTVAWTTGALYTTRRSIRIPPDALPGLGTLELVVRRGRGGPALRVSGGAAPNTGDALALQTVRVGQPPTQDPTLAAPTHPREIELGERITLLGYDLEGIPAGAGEEITLDLYWRAGARVERSYTVFVQLLDADRRLVVQQNNEPNRGRYPTSLWQPGTVIRDRYRLTLPADLEPGRYVLVVGMYEWPAIERLPVSENGVDRGDAIQLDTILVE